MSVDQMNNSKLIWKISGGLSALVIIAAAFIYLQPGDGPVTAEQVAVLKQSKTVAEIDAKTSTVEATTEVHIAPTNTEDVDALVQDSLLQQNISQNTSLAKEEIAKLEDIQEQLHTQQKMLEEQEKNAEQLIKLKEEQIKLLQQQIAAQS